MQMVDGSLIMASSPNRWPLTSSISSAGCLCPLKHDFNQFAEQSVERLFTRVEGLPGGRLNFKTKFWENCWKGKIVQSSKISLLRLLWITLKGGNVGIWWGLNWSGAVAATNTWDSGLVQHAGFRLTGAPTSCEIPLIVSAPLNMQSNIKPHATDTVWNYWK